MQNTKKANVMVLILLAFQLLIMLFWNRLVPPGLSDLATMILVQIITFLPLTLVGFFLSKKSAKSVFSLRSLPLATALDVVLLALLVQPLMSFLSLLSSLLFPNPVAEVLESFQGYPIWIILFSMAVLPALLEELFFRGLVLFGYRQQPPLRAALFSGLLFGLMHMDGQQFLYAFALGIVLGALVLRTGSIFSSILAHFTINATQVTMAWLLFSTGEATAEETGEPMLALILIGIVTLFTLPILDRLLQRIWRRHPQAIPPEKTKTQVVDFFMIAIIALFLLFVILPRFL